MGAATIRKAWQIANNGGWAETFSFYLGSTATPDDLGACTAQLNLIRSGRPPSEALTFNSTDAPSYLDVAAGSVALAIPDTLTIGWAPGVYDVQLRLIPPSGGVDRYNLVGPGRLTVIEAPGS